MSRCRWQGQTVGDFVECGNSQDMIHSGRLPVLFCASECPYRQNADYLSDSARLAAVTSQPYRPAPKSCNTCGTIKRRTSATQFVWPYWHGGASGDELRWSVRSVERFFDGPVKTTIVGDRPPWYRGHVIDQPRIGPCANRGFRDMLAKMKTMASHPEIDSEFVWMMDDVYLLQSTTWDDLDTPRAYPWTRDNSNQWQRRKWQSMEQLRQRGRPQHDYATHLPHTVERAKLAELFEEFDLQNQTLLWEVLYGNSYRGRPYGTRGFFARIQQRHSVEELAKVTAGCHVLNHLQQCWTPEMRQFLAGLLPDPASSETTDSGFVPAFRKVGRTQPRTIKRRPRHTHRAVIEAGKTQ